MKENKVKKNFKLSSFSTNSIIDSYAKDKFDIIQTYLFVDFFQYYTISDDYYKTDIFIQKNVVEEN